jgi:hypothetical protein
MKNGSKTAATTARQSWAEPESTMEADEFREVIGEVRGNAGRAMSRLNKLKVPNTVTQQRIYSEAQEYLSEALDLLLTTQLQLDDEELD